MRKFINIISSVFALLVFFGPTITHAQVSELHDTYFRAKVVKVFESGQVRVDGQMQEHQKLEMLILNGPEKNKKIVVDHGGSFSIAPYQKVAVGEIVVMAKPAETPGSLSDVYYIVDKYRLPQLAWALLFFFCLAVVFGKKRGFTSIVGLVFTAVIIFYYIIPSILDGNNPLAVCLLGAVMIIMASLYLAHGFNRRTTIALVSTFLSLGLAVLIDLFFVWLTKLSGNGTEEAFYLQFGNGEINLRGLLLGGILLGVVGVLDDVTTGQAAVVEEVYLANPKTSFKQLFDSGLSVGREHIASLINTLMLAYVGATLPLMILYTTNKLQPLWITLNSNFVAEEIIRTLVGSTVLVLAVPITTLLSAFWYIKKKT